MERQEIINRIVEKANTNSTSNEKLKYVYDWFVKNVNYAHDYLFLAETESYFAKKFFGDSSEENQRMSQFLLFSLKEAVNKNFDDVAKKLQQDGKVTFFNKDITSSGDLELAKRYWQTSYKPDFDCFEKKCGVCNTIATDFSEICKLIDVPCIKIVGTTLPKNVLHAWNAVEIDGEILHIDITYAIFDKEQGIEDKHKYFLTTEEKLLKNSSRLISDKSKQDIKALSEGTKVL